MANFNDKFQISPRSVETDSVVDYRLVVIGAIIFAILVAGMPLLLLWALHHTFLINIEYTLSSWCGAAVLLIFVGYWARLAQLIVRPTT